MNRQASAAMTVAAAPAPARAPAVFRRASARLSSAASPLRVAVLAVFALACAPAMASVATHSEAAATASVAALEFQPEDAGAVTQHVLIVSVDGLRPDAIARFGAPTMSRLIREGSHTLAARTIAPSKTLPSHTSMLTGEAPDEHGITWNSNQTHTHATVATPTVFGLSTASGLRTAAFFSKGKFNHLEAPGTLHHFQAPEGNGKWAANRTVADVERHLAAERPNLLFVHLGEPDYAGHRWGWMSWFYGRAVRQADAAIARLVAAADRAYGEGEYTLILTADHGGHGRSHGSDRAEDVTIPWIVWGEGVRAGATIAGQVRTMDTAATALWLLGLNAPQELSGAAVREAFIGSTRASSELAGISGH